LESSQQNESNGSKIAFLGLIVNKKLNKIYVKYFYFYILLNSHTLNINLRNAILLPLDSPYWDDSNEQYFIFFWLLDQKLVNCLINNSIWQKCQSVTNQVANWWLIGDWLAFLPNTITNQAVC